MESNTEITTPVEGEQPVAPAIVETVAPVVEEKSYEYQPTDEDNRPIGGKQVIKYRSQEELLFKLQEQNTLLIRKLRSETKKNRLGIQERETIEETAPRYKTPVEFNPKQLSPEVRAQLSRDILDPETFDTAVTTIFESALGINASDLRGELTDLRQDNLASKAQREVDKFVAKNPDYIGCQENFEAITHWMLRYDLAPVADNFQKAFDTLKASDLLVMSVEVVPQATYTPPVAEPVAPAATAEEIVPTREEIPVENQVPVEKPAEKPPVVSRVPTGLNNSNSSTAAPQPAVVGDDILYEYVQKDAQGRQVGEKRVFRGLAALNAMPSEEYKRRIVNEKGFAKKAEKLWAGKKG